MFVMMRRAATITGVTASLLGMATSAWASTSWTVPTTYTSGCVYLWGTKGEQPYTNGSSSGVSTSSTHISVTSWRAYANAGADCGTGGYQTYAAKIQITNIYTFDGTSMSCSMSYPLGYSCSTSGSTLTLTEWTTCGGGSVASCTLTGSNANFYVSAGGSFYAIYQQTKAQYWNSAGNSTIIGPTVRKGVSF